MTPVEVNKIMSIIKAEYPRSFEITEERALLWAGILKHAKYKEALDAVIAILGQPRPWPPQVGEVNDAILNARKIANRKNQIFKLQKREDVPEEQRKANIKLLGDLLNRLTEGEPTDGK